MEKGSKHTEDTKKRIASALSENDNAKKWHEELVIDILKAMIVFLQTDIETDVIVQEEVSSIQDDEGNDLNIKNSKKVVKKIKTRPHLKKQAKLEFGIYQKKWFSYIANQFKDNETVSYLLCAIDDICEVNTYDSASRRVTDPSMAKMNLSHHYNWSDKTEVQKKEDKKGEDLSKLPTDELKRRIAEAKRITEARDRTST